MSYRRYGNISGIEMSNPYTPPEARLDPHTPPEVRLDPRPDMRPRWVRLGLLGLSSRGRARAFLYLSLLLAAVGLLFGVWPGLGMLAAAAWYWAAIRWMDRHDGW